MRGRTRLTTSPGEEPIDDSRPAESAERYVGGFELPTEPDVPSRHRGRIIAFVVVAVLALGGFVGYRMATEGQFQDPALSDLLPGEDDPSPEGSPTG